MEYTPRLEECRRFYADLGLAVDAEVTAAGRTGCGSAQG